MAVSTILAETAGARGELELATTDGEAPTAVEGTASVVRAEVFPQANASKETNVTTTLRG
jgi:hypothetical protein